MIERENAIVVYTVEDDRAGIASDEQERIFEPGVRGRARRVDGEPGAGLGLALARRLARAADGDVSVEPTAPGGRFLIRLPSGWSTFRRGSGDTGDCAAMSRHLGGPLALAALLATTIGTAANAYANTADPNGIRQHLARLPREPGSVAGWQNHRFRRRAAFVVELPPGTLDGTIAIRFANAVQVISRASLKSQAP